MAEPYRPEPGGRRAVDTSPMSDEFVSEGLIPSFSAPCVTCFRYAQAADTALDPIAIGRKRSSDLVEEHFVAEGSSPKCVWYSLENVLRCQKPDRAATSPIEMCRPRRTFAFDS